MIYCWYWKKRSLGATGALACVNVTQEVNFMWACVSTHATECLHDTKWGYAWWSSRFMSSYLLLDNPLTNTKNKMTQIFWIFNTHIPYIYTLHVSTGKNNSIFLLKGSKLQWNIGYVPSLHLLEFYIKCNYSDLQNCLLRELRQRELDANLLIYILLLFLSYFHWMRQTGLWWHFLRPVSVKPLRMSLDYSFPTLKETLVFYQAVKIMQIYENRFLHRHPEV